MYYELEKNRVKDQIFLSRSLFRSDPEIKKVNLKNSIHRKLVEYQIKQLKNELAKLEE